MASSKVNCLLDTNILISFGNSLETAPDLVGLGTLHVSALSWAELSRGLYSTQDVHEFRRRQGALRTLNEHFGSGLAFDDQCIPAYEFVISKLSEGGRSTRAHVIDRMIAATAITHSLAIVTRDKAGFAGLEGLVPILER